MIEDFVLHIREIVRGQSNIWDNLGLAPIVDENPILEIVFNKEEERVKGEAYVATLNRQQNFFLTK